MINLVKVQLTNMTENDLTKLLMNLISLFVLILLNYQ